MGIYLIAEISFQQEFSLQVKEKETVLTNYSEGR